MASFVSALVAGIEILYGCIFLSAALLYSIFQKEFWRAQTKEEELAFREGDLTASIMSYLCTC